MAQDGVRMEQDGADVRLWVKAVPGASRDQISGRVGERLKVRVNAPPEGGKANQAIVRLLAQRLGVKARDIAIESGATSPEKVLRIAAVTVGAVRERLAP